MERNRIINKNDVPEYEPFGGEWEREISKLTKKELIGFIRNVCKQKQEAESRLKTWLAVREEELYYARLGVVKHIKIAQNLHKDKNLNYQTKPALICIVESLLYAIKKDTGKVVKSE